MGFVPWSIPAFSVYVLFQNATKKMFPMKWASWLPGSQPTLLKCN